MANGRRKNFFPDVKDLLKICPGYADTALRGNYLRQPLFKTRFL
jgi:hypothetical protein